jgi:hypothetical protein
MRRTQNIIRFICVVGLAALNLQLRGEFKLHSITDYEIHLEYSKPPINCYDTR